MIIWENILAGVVILIFATLMYGAGLIVKDKEREFQNRRNQRKTNDK